MALELPAPPPRAPLPPPPWFPLTPPSQSLSPPLRPPPGRTFTILAVVLVVVCVGAAGLFAWVFVVPSPANNYCPSYYASCPGGTPLGSAFAFGNSTSEMATPTSVTQSGCSHPATGEEYCEILTITVATSGLSTNAMTFQLRTGNGTEMPYASVTLIDPHSLGIAQLTPGGTWRICTPALCETGTSPLAGSLPATLSASYELVLNGGPSATFPHGLRSLDLTAIGVGPFSGTVAATLS
jgi:hypothetical protein